MALQRARIQVSVKPGEIYGYVADLSLLPTWHWSIIGAEVYGPMRIGMSIPVRCSEGENPILTITSLEPGRRVAFQLQVGDTVWDENLGIVPSAGKCSVTYTVVRTHRPRGLRKLVRTRYRPQFSLATKALSALRVLLEPEDPVLDARSRAQLIEQELDEINREASRTRSARRAALVLTGIALVVALGIVALSLSGGDLRVLVLTYSVFPILFWLSLSTGDEEIRARRLESQLELQDPSVDPIERRAQSLFRLHQAELDKYYVQARRQSFWAFVVGAMCIALGFAVVTIAIVGFLFRDLSDPEKIAVGALGAIGGIMSNFIAVLALRMFSDSVRSLGQLHTRLVTTNHLHFANFLAAKIETQPLREQTIAAIASGLADRMVKLELDQVEASEVALPSPTT